VFVSPALMETDEPRDQCSVMAHVGAMVRSY